MPNEYTFDPDKLQEYAKRKDDEARQTRSDRGKKGAQARWGNRGPAKLEGVEGGRKGKFTPAKEPPKPKGKTPPKSQPKKKK